MPTAARAAFDERGKQIAKELENYIIPDDKVNDIVAYCVDLVTGNPQMKNKRIARKAAEKFKLQVK